jgi:hypothetical protein
MDQPTEPDKRILAIDPCTQGFGYAVMEGMEYLVDWGLRETRRDKNRVCLKSLSVLLEAYHPDLLIIEDCMERGSRRRRRIRELIRRIYSLSERLGIKMVTLSPKKVRETFAEWQALNKHQMAIAIGNMYPELIPRMPPERKCWMSEDPRTNIFDAVALGITYFYKRNRHQHSA